MTKKLEYSSPEVEIVEMGYADPVCQATSGSVPDYNLFEGFVWDDTSI